MGWAPPDLSSGKTMRHILCVILATQLLRLEATPCDPWEYQIGQNCCPLCGSGYRVAKHCTVASGISCLPCTEGTYTDHPNGLSECLRCHICDSGAHLRIKEPCTYTKNTLCSCTPGYYCILSGDGGCELCQKHTVSPPGFMVTQPGTETSDAQIAPCPPQTFSATENARSCQPWANCREKDLREKRAGSQTSDAVCLPHEPSRTIPVAVSLIVILVLGGAAISGYLILQKRSRNGNDRPQQETNGFYMPVQETEINMREPMQETTQSLGEPAYVQT